MSAGENYARSSAGGLSGFISEEKTLSFDWWLLGFAMILLSLGLIMVFSTSGAVGMAKFGDKYYFFKRQMIFACGGVVAMAVCAGLSRGFLNSLKYPMLLVTLALLALTISPFGRSVNGARRWLHLGPFSLQPMEFAKIALVFYLAFFMSTKQAIIKTFSRGIIPPFAVTGVYCALLLLQPDFGGAVVLSLLLFLMCLIGGTRVFYLVMSAALALGAAVLLVIMEPYRYKRLIAFLDPFDDPTGLGHQLVQAFLAMGSGGFFGVGLGAGQQKLLYLPEGHTDFIIPLFGEEVGFFGISLVVLLMALLVWRGLLTAVRQGNLRDRFTAFGLTMILAISMILNLAVITGMAPPKGVPMPFFSYGGSSLLTSLICVGLLLNYSRTASPGDQ